jgi:predicted Zn-dependent peptidase
MLNRRLAPPVHQVSNLLLPYPKVLRLDNGIPLYVLDFPGQEVLKVEAVFRAGRPQEEKRLAARATARLLREGTSTRKGAEIAEHFDFYGASVSVPTNLDTANFVLFSLSKYAADVIPVFAELLRDPSFPEDELETFRRTSIQELSIELEKVETLAYRKVTELIFGEDHPYGYNSVADDYTGIQREDLQDFFKKWYTPSNCQLFASGHVDENILKLLNQHFGTATGIVHSGVSPVIPPQAAIPKTQKAKQVSIAHPGSLQTAIKIGRRAFGRSHPDFNGLFVLNTMLGGYFGSRLMAQIREKKGYTYNIYSTLDAYLTDGCLYIATEVDPGNAAATVKAIFAEMKKMREKPVPPEELEMVRNYLLGMLLNGLDGPMNISDMVRGMIVEELPWESFTDMVETIRTITAEDVQLLAQRYLQPDDFWTVTVG